jgi:hypothetical protein
MFLYKWLLCVHIVRGGCFHIMAASVLGDIHHCCNLNKTYNQATPIFQDYEDPLADDYSIPERKKVINHWTKTKNLSGHAYNRRCLLNSDLCSHQMCSEVPAESFDLGENEFCPFSIAHHNRYGLYSDEHVDFGPCSSDYGFGVCARHKMELAVYTFQDGDSNQIVIEGTKNGVAMLRMLSKDEITPAKIKPIPVCAFHRVRTAFIFRLECDCGGQKFAIREDSPARGNAWRFYGEILDHSLIIYGDSAYDYCCSNSCS